MLIKGKINKIIDLSVVDGPGNRTSIFLQGCNFNCFYCHNPETIKHCINCMECINFCPTKSLINENGKVVWNDKTCINCDECIRVCRFLSSPKIYNWTVQETVDRIKKNMPFIRGITVSGGECTLQHHFLVPLFKEVKKLGLTCFVDTNGSLPFKKLKELVDVTDSFMLDVKAFDNDEHIFVTQKSVHTVLENADYLASIDKLFEIRTVTVAGMDNESTVDSITKMLNKYIKMGHNIKYKIIKYRSFGVRERYSKFSSPTDDEMNKLKNIALSNGFKDVIIV
ncbi:MAG: YjjW family glycine radical enzyme activase [Peptoniphilaceae bacterium]|uniref:YjjW family glycine radical enzyme activase n=1 Tax=Parvimonas sp. TaxID=1944660 RepID=UPI0025F39847|nr:YjjW family glycine radical enzyme activase [Parvimonas sp.]MCI5997156.1 YjjW family glycine radical enzyme activase [Parvimonas sp.]MDD7764248.1 YjjW family glycine radical enzyme activase [Peptoniphilaceae bacterium]MDY3051511.1 YjjW family glycine radical enzyme activase [Parvimonas sp.]